MQYIPSPASHAAPEHPDWYTYTRQGGYFSVPRTGNSFAQLSGRSPYGHSFRGYPEAGYGFDDYDYGQNIPPPPEYPDQDPLRTPVRPREPQTPNTQLERDTKSVYRDEVENRPRKKRSSTPKKAETLPEDKVTNAEIMEMLRKIQQEVKENAEIRSDPGRQEYRGHRNLSPTSQFLVDDNSSVDAERQKIFEIKGFIRRLLEDRQNQEYPDSYAGTSRSFTDSHHNRAEMDRRETMLMRQRDLEGLEARVSRILDLVEMRISSLPQQQRGTYNNRQGYHIPRYQTSPVEDPFILEPTSPTLSRPPSRRTEYTQPTGTQRQDTQVTNEVRLRQQASWIPEAEEIPEEYLEA